jgi:predicted nucleic acid-binding protein
MNAVVDTNVIAYFLLGTQPFRDEVRAFWREIGEVCAPASWEAELTNVLWLAVRHGGLRLEQALAMLKEASSLGIVSEPVQGLWEGALVLAARREHPGYDTLFVELALRRGVPLATFDKEVLRTFPEWTARPGTITAGASS